jgi:Rrf2 family protein
MRISAKADYAVRAAAELAAYQASGLPAKSEQLAITQSIPQKFLENILSELRRAGIVRSQRGSDGGYFLSRPATEVTVADVLRAVEGPLAAVQGTRPEALDYGGAAAFRPEVWVAARSSLRSVLEHVSLADIASGDLPAVVRDQTRAKESWRPH